MLKGSRHSLETRKKMSKPHRGSNSPQCIREHRLVMAKYLNRCLLPWEVVHHKNGDKQDNRIENLELLPTHKYHLVDSTTKSIIKSLQNKVAVFEAENIILRQRLNGGTKCMSINV